MTPERDRLNSLVDYSSVQTLPEVLQRASDRFSNTIALKDPHSKPEIALTFTQLYQQIRQFGAGLQALLPTSDEPLPPRVALFADNSPRWMIADQGIMIAGAANVVRSASAEREELLYILSDSGSVALVAENLALVKRLRAGLDNLQFVVLLSDETPDAEETLKIINYAQLMEAGANRALAPVSQNEKTLATLLYTSGTTGKPKGVMLTHGNLLHQVRALGAVIQPQVGDRALSILPTWHAYERSAEYFILSQGITQIYTNLRNVKKDLKEFKPQYVVGVPRLWESIYEGVQKQFREQPANKQKLVQRLLGISQQYIHAKRLSQGLSLDNLNPSLPEKLAASLQAAALYPLHALAGKLVYQKVREATGGKIRSVISGGGSLAKHLDEFFEIVGIEVLVGYGLTETSPVTNARRSWRNLRGSSGAPIPGTEIKIVDPETRQALPQGEKGLVLIRGPQVMQGYYQKPEATAKAIDGEGWFDSGDLGWVTPQNDLVLTGRAKDTIVLTNGENIEPQPIEDACLRSPYIDQIMLVGQDRRSLGALIVPNMEALEKWLESQNLLHPVPDSEPNIKKDIDLNSKEIQALFRAELNREVQNRPGYRADDRIGPMELILEPFSIENGMMTQTLKIRRPVVTERYCDIIERMFT